MHIKKFLSLYLQYGDLKSTAKAAGIHPNTVYSWIKSRNNPHVMSLVWFFKAIAQQKNVSYEMMWIEFVYLLEGKEDPKVAARQWIHDYIDTLVSEDPSWLRKHYERLVLEIENAQR